MWNRELAASLAMRAGGSGCHSSGILILTGIACRLGTVTTLDRGAHLLIKMREYEIYLFDSDRCPIGGLW